MNLDPIEIALRQISETKHLLDSLITSSESFDYRKAKLALKALEKKSRELGKLKTAMEIQTTPLCAAPSNVIAFPRQ